MDLWYIWKGRNNKVFNNIDIDPRDTIELPETESILLHEAQRPNNPTTQCTIQNRELQLEMLPQISGRWCFTDGSWKENDKFS